MGNSQSHEENPHSPAPGSRKGTPQPGSRHRDASRDAAARKTPSGSSHVTKGAVLPFSTPASTSTTYTTNVSATVARSPVSSRSRARSVNSAHTPKPITGDDSPSSQRSQTPIMGNSESKNRPPSRSATLPFPPPNKDVAVAHATVAPVPISDDGGMAEKIVADDVATFESPFSLPASDYSRPPRLPLPIEEEPHAPGSPIITSLDLGSSLDANDVEGAIPRRTSVLSSTTADEEEDTGHVEFATDANSMAPTVSTTIEWKGAGDKIYVTGTFVNWERKFKLHRDREHGGFSASLGLKPGTHHIKFLVDGEMITSEDLPTTVDYTNILVNYIEVVAPLPASEPEPPAPAEPMDIPTVATGQASVTPNETRTEALDIPGSRRPSDRGNAFPQETVLPERNKSVSDRGKESHAAPTSHVDASQAQQLPKQQKIPRAKYTNQLPEYLHDLDVYIDPGDERNQRVNRVIGHLPAPPSLPMFMSKSILNGTTPHKDDASVLIMPNHTVLNHLATSSIKHGVLATSATTRYKRKFLTTIMYKPTSDDG
ncbi:snf1 protein kinase subunit beta-3 [Acrodontium crateriforme]|uniref:Snf1 protein kinase subunit beta-3 n=1 Tax=Acrodontium crateriforme TaxID=150365 RepID=A0AAQ3M9F9_9PEZI|nr:snf1 protein kinase subunit beta-3 [Acrodontium crateriforme]